MKVIMAIKEYSVGLRSIMLRNSRFLLSSVLLALVMSCSIGGYESGDGELSYVRADFTDITVKDGLVASAVTDDGVSLVLPASLAYGNANANDTVLRRLLYYNKVNETDAIQIFNQKTVSVITPVERNDAADMKTDPVVLTSAWLSANRKYVNMHLGVKCGSSDSGEKQYLLLRTDEISHQGAGSITFTLCHEQSEMEEYYTQDVYLSVLAAELPDTIKIKVNTYSGITTRILVK